LKFEIINFSSGTFQGQLLDLEAKQMDYFILKLSSENFTIEVLLIELRITSHQNKKYSKKFISNIRTEANSNSTWN
jgi:hypothetical protein